MLRKGFLGLLSDWVMNFLQLHPEALDKAMEEFGLQALLRQEDSPDKVGTLFTEWLVFDHKSSAFDGASGIAYFCSRNPLGLTEEDLRAYRELCDFKVGYFEVAAVRPAQSVKLRDIAGAMCDVADVNSSMSLAAGETVWTRIAAIAGVYHMVGSQVLRAPISYSVGMKKIIQGWGKNAADAKHAAAMAHGNSPSDPPNYVITPEQEAAHDFDKALKAAGMNEMISSATVRRWANSEQKFPAGFPMKAVYFLMPERIDDKKRDAVLSALQNYLANLPRRALKGKTPIQASTEQKLEERRFDIDMFSYEDYADDVRGANDLMPIDPNKAYVSYERLINRLLEERMPLVTAFRIFCNAGLSLVQKNKAEIDPLGLELIRASLRLNPFYSFGMRQKVRLIDLLYDLAQVPKKDRALCESIASTAEEDGVRQYRRTPFRKYEKFLADAGVSLKHVAVTEITSWRTGEDGKAVKIGRNDQCYCRSSKKFKKCCEQVAGS